MKLVSIIGIAVITSYSIVGLAGKTERAYLKEQVAPAIAEATKAFKSACGCPLKITLKEATFKTVDDMRPAKYTAESITKEVGGYCTDDASKKAVCKMKSLEIVKADKVAFTFKGGKGVASTDGQGYVLWETMTPELDK
jgi:hypothetical protein